MKPVREWWLNLLSPIAVALPLAGQIAAPPQVPPHASRPAPLVFRGATVIDVRDGRRQLDQTVVVMGNRIAAMGTAQAVPTPPDAQVIEAHGQYLIPGLWDMHAHLDDRARERYPRFIASGVTGLREMSQRFPHGADSFRVWQRRVAAGTLVGPRVFGPSADVVTGETFDGSVGVNDPDEVPHVVDSLKAAGMIFLKMHDDFMPLDLYFALARAARRVSIPMVGHTPLKASDIDIADSGQRSIEHNNEVRCGHPSQGRNRPRDMTVAGGCAATAAAFIRNGTWFDPTIVTWTCVADYRRSDPATWSENDSASAYWHQDGVVLVQALRQAGFAQFLAGSDCTQDEQMGVTMPEELRDLVEAGLSPLEALQAATLNPAKFFGATDSLGTVTAGKLADFVLLDADPLADIANTAAVRAVVANGRYFDRAALDGLLRDAQVKTPRTP